MSFQDTQGIIDSLKERISNPFMFTYSWLFIVCNWKAVGWFLFEPLKFSLKLQRFQFTGLDIYILKPLFFTILLLLVGHALNNFSEICKRFWDYRYAKVLQRIGWKEFVDKAIHDKLHDEKLKLEGVNRQLILDAKKAYDSEQNKIKMLSDLSKQVGKYEEESEKTKSALASAEQEIVDITAQLENYKKLEDSTKLTKIQKEKTNQLSFNEPIGKLFYRETFYEPLDEIKVFRNKIHEFEIHNLLLDHNQQVLISMSARSSSDIEPPIVSNVYGPADRDDIGRLIFQLPVELGEYKLHIELLEPSAVSGNEITTYSKLYFLSTY
ncbi:hypothetical protein [Pseudoalteromonas peptidolytica]|uniref:hypothetical protein n=1 Tax=Pseudoalteromonas peptidolytica TaxID=61150 RepID=UPI00298DD24B|nr:hypothetical protein [Pseudoalteromonas peptidolytica]MDW7548187.1 hypothetical protein [Pseudoalteromonas peptidolytica]